MSSGLGNVSVNYKYVLVWMIGTAHVTLVHAATIDSDTTIDSTILENVEIVDGDSPPTTVDFVEGALVPQLLTSGSSVLNLFGGGITDELGSQDESLINIHAGLISDTQFGGDSTVKFFGGTVEESFAARDSANIDISGGLFREDFDLFDESTLGISGGELHSDIEARGQSTVNIYGGTFYGVVANGTVNVFGFGLAFNDGMVTGRFANGRPASLPVWLVDDGQLILHEVPEPSTFVLLLGAMLLISLRQGCHRRASC